MILEEIMKTDVITLAESDTIKTAIQIVNEKKIRHIPVVNQEDHVVGLITDRDLRDAAPSIFHAEEHQEDLERPLSSIMQKQVITGHPLDFVEEVSALFYEHDISCLPVVTEKKLVGIITETDLLHTLVKLTGANQPGSQIEIRVPNRTGLLSEIATLIKSKNSNINSILVYPDKMDEAYKVLVIRVQTMNPSAVIQELRDAGHEVLWPKLPGLSL
ncbi:acetoin utilization protein AcuB [Peribacillus deserti]|uniref:Acetoin utilization protein AcuB n=1 Tax=Peribacillus deserti TaxID=673318 RepID=A0ABS2QIG1_9BACI|nr:acetoin utilization AcuB family protein [Peribacillus deserti]MBM7692919.1 acetoin utilization protein AcuB [Peribacillus deserti]